MQKNQTILFTRAAGPAGTSSKQIVGMAWMEIPALQAQKELSGTTTTLRDSFASEAYLNPC